MKKQLLSLLCLAIFTSLFAQTIPNNRKVDWSICGYEGEIPCRTVVRNAVTEFGVDKTGAADATAKVNAALTSINNDEVLYFPAGTYLFNGPINVPSKRVIRGESPSTTIFNFTFTSNNTCFSIIGAGETGVKSNATAIGAFGGNTITLSNASNFKVGDDVELYQANDNTIHGAEDVGDIQTWATDLKGQMAKVKAINGNVVTVDRSLVFDYDINFAITLSKVALVEEVGMESFKLVRQSNNGTGYGNNNVWISYAKNCWMRKVHLEYSSRYHFQIDHSRNIEISEIFMDKAYSCGSGGAGYGLMLQDHVSECLFENNIAKALRHPWIVKEGCARNVYAYNYSSGTTQGDACNSDPLTDSYADISLHGHYPAYNLFEGNIVYRIASSDAWGPNGPGNTFLRNRVLGLKGVWIQSYSRFQNVIGNELTYPSAQFEMDKDGTVTGTTLNYSNYGTTGLLDAAAPNTVENSFYLSSKPAFFGAAAWPSIGPGVSFNTGKIPAQERFTSGKFFTDGPSCSACKVPDLGVDQSLCGKTSIQLKGFATTPSGYAFAWYKNGNKMASTTATITVTTAGDYKLETDSAGCINSDVISISATLPALSLGAAAELCSPSELVLQGNITDPAYSYKWLKNGLEIATTQTYTATSAGTYELEVAASGCTTVKASKVLTSKLLTVKGDTICKTGDVATVEVVGNSSYKWYNTISGGSPIGTTKTITTTQNKVYIEDAAGVSSILGMLAPDFTNSRTWDDNRFDRKLKFDVLAPLSIDSLSFWPSKATSVTVRVMASNNTTVVYQKTYTSVALGLENRVAFGSVLTPGSYYLDFVGTNDKLYYSNNNDLTIKYPYTVNGLISITGADPAWVTTSPYYMFAYKWRITTGNTCNRTPVVNVVDSQHKDCLVTAFEDNLDANLFIYPNPSTQGFQLKGIENAKITILSTSGNVLETQNISEGETFGNLLESGAYILQVVTIDRQYHYKIVKF